MTTWSRRSLLGTGVLLGAAAYRPAPSWAQDVLRQDNPGQGTYWLPIISAFYVKDLGDPVWPDGDGPPVFPQEVNPPLRFTTNPAPAESAPTIDTDWVVFQQRYQRGEQASAWVMAREFGKPRLWIHRCYDEEYLAGYVQNHRLQLILDIDVVRESFPLPDTLSRPARRQLIAEKVQVVSGSLEIIQLNGVRKNGSGGSGDVPLLKLSLPGGPLQDLTKNARTLFVPRAPTVPDGDKLNGVVRIAVEFEVEAGTDLGLATPERKELAGEIRFAVGQMYVEITKLTGEDKKK
jgi:hypothetical protein